MIEKFKCRLCKSVKGKEYHIIGKEHLVYECASCGFIQIPTPPADKLDAEAATQSRNQDEFRKTGLGDMHLNAKSKLPPILRNLAHVIEEDGRRITNFFDKFLKEKTYLKSAPIEFIDIGSGYGNNSFLLKKEFPNLNITLLEISSERIKMGVDAFEPNLNDFTFCHSLLDSSFAKENLEKFDITFSFHVLEHVYDVINFIKNTFSILKPGGHAIFEVPNQHDDLQELSNNYKSLIHFPAHVNYFSKDTFLKLLEESGTSEKFISSFIPIQRYGFYNYVDWVRYNKKEKILSDDYRERGNMSWLEKLWLREKKENLTTDSLMIVLEKAPRFK